MMSIAQFTGSTSSQCASYTTDGTSGWSLASMEDMGLIKANVDKINAQLAKIPNTKKLKRQSNQAEHHMKKIFLVFGKPVMAMLV